jgi:glycosyltransferase involved in cell wall biosynthesis
MLSVVVLTKNEQNNIAKCLKSLSWCDDIVVLDSYSTDRTIEIAEALGARVVQHEFEDFAHQRNFAATNIPFRHAWLFHIDADEVFTPQLAEECRQVVRRNEFSGFYVPSKMMLFGRWLQHSGMYPSYQVRLIRLGEIEFDQVGHGQREHSSGRGLGVLSEPYLHYSFSCGFEQWFAKHNRYSSDEALHNCLSREQGPIALRELLTADGVRRRRALKRLAARMPLRASLRFLYMFILRRGFLDGRAGLTYCTLMAIYEYLIGLKMREYDAGRLGEGL